jgi:hypothetical protein
MKQEEINEILRKHKMWLEEEINGERADFRGANLEGADFRGANLRRANLEDANLEDADLEDADLEDANLRGANFRGANLEGANFDFSCFPLWCGSFNTLNSDRLVKQLLSHIARMSVANKELEKWIKQIPKEYKNDICNRHDIEKV